MNRFIVLCIAFYASVIVAGKELWVVYHQGCPSCENFLNTVIPSYPAEEFSKTHPLIPIKLLDAGFPDHQKVIATISPAIMSTPTFLYVQNTEGTVYVLYRWTGFKDKQKFYEAFDSALQIKTS